MGVPQVSPLSPILFIDLIQDLLDWLGRGFYASNQAFVDDIIVWWIFSYGHSYGEIFSGTLDRWLITMLESEF